MEKEKFNSWLKDNFIFLLALLCEVLLLVGIFTSLVTTKGAIATFVSDPELGDYYEISKAHDRETLNIFQSVKEGTSWPFFVLYGLGFLAIPFSYKGKCKIYVEDYVISFAKRIVKVKYISLGNLCIDKLAFKELIQDDCNPDALVTEVRKLIEDRAYRGRMLKDYEQIRSLLGGSGASDAVASAMIEELK